MADENNMESMILDMMNKLGGIEKFKSNPFAFIGEIFQHPELLGQIDKMAKTPEMQKQIAESMNNPMFQQIVSNNPMLSGLMNQYKNRTAAQNTVDLNAHEEPDVIETDALEVDGFEFNIPGWKPIDWLNPQSNQPFYIPTDKKDRVLFNDILDELPEECRERVEIIAQKRLAMHLNPMQLDHLESLAARYELTPLDLMATQGFIGEVCYCATLIMPDDDLCDLAKFALATLMRRSGYPVPSYISQILLYLDSFDSIDREDWERFVWALSANPASGRDGNFAISWEDASLIAEIANDNLAQEPELLFAVLLSLLGWNELNIPENPVQTLFQPIQNKDDMRDRLIDALSGKKTYALSLPSMRPEIQKDAIPFILAQDGLDKLLAAAATWPPSAAATAKLLVDKLDLLWSKAGNARYDFLDHAIQMHDESLALAAFKVGVAWDPDKYRLQALDSEFLAVREWIEKK